jgi:hypothetical protein
MTTNSVRRNVHEQCDADREQGLFVTWFEIFTIALVLYSFRLWLYFVTSMKN